MRLFLAASLLLLAGSVSAQFRVTASTPADGAVAVGLTTTLTLTFSEPVAAAPSMVSLPLDSISVGAATVSGDQLTVSYPVTHTANTRFVHLVLAAEAASGAALERPFAFAYTTSASAGSFRVGGQITATEGTPDAVIALLVGIGTDGSFSVADAAVLSGTTGTYSLGPVPLGIYTVGAFRLPAADPPRSFAYGFYDTNGDGTPDPALPTPPFQNNLTIGPPAPATARDRLDEAVAEAEGRAPDARLFALPETVVDTTGGAPLWTFTFYSPAQDSTITVLATGLIPFAFSTAGSPPTLSSIQDGWVDSDVAVAAAEGAGGEGFRDGHRDDTVLIGLRGGLYPDVPTDATPAWRVVYRASDGVAGPALDSLIVYVSMLTGTVISTTAAAPAPVSDAYGLEAPSPNPAAGPVQLAYTLAAAGRVTLRVFDAAGREVAVLDAGERAAGRHAVAWTPPTGLASGVYAVRLDAGASSWVRRLTLAR